MLYSAYVIPRKGAELGANRFGRHAEPQAVLARAVGHSCQRFAGAGFSAGRC